jgi:hypothetical protein
VSVDLLAAIGDGHFQLLVAPIIDDTASGGVEGEAPLRFLSTDLGCHVFGRGQSDLGLDAHEQERRRLGIGA